MNSTMRHEEYQRPLAQLIVLPAPSDILVSFSVTGQIGDFDDEGGL